MESRPNVNQTLAILQGRKAVKFVMINFVNGHNQLLVDGEKRKYDRPKDNINHMIPTHFISPEVQNSLLATGRVTNGKLRTLYRGLSN